MTGRWELPFVELLMFGLSALEDDVDKLWSRMRPNDQMVTNGLREVFD